MNNYIDCPPEVLVNIMKYLDYTKTELLSLAIVDKRTQAVFQNSKKHLFSINLNQALFPPDMMNFASKEIKLNEDNTYLQHNPTALSATSIFIHTATQLYLHHLTNDSFCFIKKTQPINPDSIFYLNGWKLISHQADSPIITKYHKKKAVQTVLPKIFDNEKIGKIQMISENSEYIVTFNSETKILHSFNPQKKQHIKVQLNHELQKIGVNEQFFYYVEEESSEVKVHFHKTPSTPLTIHLKPGDNFINLCNKNIFVARIIDEVATVIKIDLKRKTQAEVKINKYTGILRIRPIDERHAILLETIKEKRELKLSVLDFQEHTIKREKIFTNIVKINEFYHNNVTNNNDLQIHYGVDRLVYITKTPQEERVSEEDRFTAHLVKFKAKSKKKSK